MIFSSDQSQIRQSNSVTKILISVRQKNDDGSQANLASKATFRRERQAKQTFLWETRSRQTPWNASYSLLVGTELACSGNYAASRHDLRPRESSFYENNKISPHHNSTVRFSIPSDLSDLRGIPRRADTSPILVTASQIILSTFKPAEILSTLYRFEIPSPPLSSVYSPR